MYIYIEKNECKNFVLDVLNVSNARQP